MHAGVKHALEKNISIKGVSKLHTRRKDTGMQLNTCPQKLSAIYNTSEQKFQKQLPVSERVV